MLALHRVAHQHVMIKLRVKYGHGRDVPKKKTRVDFQEIECYFDKVMPQTAKTHDRKEKNRQWKETNITVGITF